MCTGIQYLYQRAQLEEEFNDLMKSVPVTMKDSFHSVLDSQACADLDADTEDENLILADYYSDDNKAAGNSDSENEEEGIVHCTKVGGLNRNR